MVSHKINSSNNHIILINDSLIVTLLPYVIFSTLGLMTLLCNILLLASLLWHPVIRRRKTFVIIAGLSFANCLEGLAAALGGFISYSGGIDMANVVWVPAIECLTRLWPLIFFWSAYATSLMMLVLSLDRLTSVAIPLAYYRLGVGCSKTAVACSYLVSLLLFCSALIEPISSSTWRLVSTRCYATDISPIYELVAFYATSALSFASIAVYLMAVVLLFKWKLSMEEATSSKDPAFERRHQQKYQKRITMTCGLISASTLMLDCLPRIAAITMVIWNNHNDKDNSIAMYLFALLKVNAIVYCFILWTRHKNIRQGLLAMIECRRLRLEDRLQEMSSRKTITVAAENSQRIVTESKGTG